MKRLVSAHLQGPAFRLVIALFAVLPFCNAEAETATVALLLQQTPNQGGIVTPGIGVHHFEPNARVSLSAVPQVGFQFVYWLGDVLDPKASTTTAYLDRPKIIIAVFEQANFAHQVAGERVVTGAGGGIRGARSSGGGLRVSSPSVSSGRPGVSTPSGGGSSGGGNPPIPVIPDPPSPPDPPIIIDPPIIDPPEPPIPEPATVVLLGLGGLALLRRRRNR